MLFQQTSAPTGWTKVTSGVDNKALRVVSGTVGSGGTNAFSNTLASRGITANAGNTTAGGNISVANATQGGNISVGNTTAGGNVSISSVSTSGNVNSHTLSINEMPAHNHNTYAGPRNSSSNTQGNLAAANLVNLGNPTMVTEWGHIMGRKHLSGRFQKVVVEDTLTDLLVVHTPTQVH